MSRDQVMIFVLLVAIFNGLFSPWVLVAVGMAPAWMPNFLPYTPPLLFYGASLLVSTLTFLVAAAPAALAERFLDEVTPVGALWIWFAVACVLSVPAIENAIAMM
jgi:hypothetical protein